MKQKDDIHLREIETNIQNLEDLMDMDQFTKERKVVIKDLYVLRSREFSYIRKKPLDRRDGPFG